MVKPVLMLAVGLALGGFIGKAVSEIPESFMSVPTSQYTRHMAVTALSRLHYLKIDEVESLEASLTRQIPTDTLIISKMNASNELDSEEVQENTKFLVLVAVMDEKFEIEEWRNNKEFQAILDSVRASNKEHADKLRCFNWSKPMWVDRGDCP